jgi:hypothetical protein
VAEERLRFFASLRMTLFSGQEEFVLSALVLSAFHDALLYRSWRIGLTGAGSSWLAMCLG